MFLLGGALVVLHEKEKDNQINDMSFKLKENVIGRTDVCPWKEKLKYDRTRKMSFENRKCKSTQYYIFLEEKSIQCISKRQASLNMNFSFLVAILYTKFVLF